MMYTDEMDQWLAEARREETHSEARLRAALLQEQQQEREQHTQVRDSRVFRSALNKNTLHNTFVIYFWTHFRAHRSSSFGGGPRDPALPQCGRRCRGDLSRTTGTASGRTSTKWWRWSAKTTTTCRPYTGPGFRTSVVEGADRTL